MNVKSGFALLVLCMFGWSAMADRTITEDFSLSQNTDWSGETLTIGNGVTVDLKGHSLTVAAISGSTAGSPVITDTVGGGSLHIAVGDNVTTVNDKVRLAGHLRLEKDGPGKLQISLASQTYDGGTVVNGGTLVTTLKGVNYPMGGALSTVQINAGATFDFNGQCDFYNYTWFLNGGTLRNNGSAAGTNLAMMRMVTLLADSTVSGHQFGMVGSGYADTRLALNGHTLNVEMDSQSDIFHVINCTIGEGTVHLKRGTFYIHGGSKNAHTYGVRTDFVGDVGTTITSSNGGYFHARSITTSGHMIGTYWHYVDAYNHSVPEGVVSTNSAAINRDGSSTSNVILTKTGKGLLVLGNSGNNTSITGGVVVAEGCVKLTNKNALGNAVPVQIKNGATIDVNSIGGGYVAKSCSVSGNGWDGNGAIQNNGEAGPNYNQATPLAALTLAGNTSVGGSSQLVFINSSYNAITWELGAYTLTKIGSGRLMPANTTMTGTGRFIVSEGSLAANGSLTVNPRTVFKSGATLDLSIPNPDRGATITLADCEMEPGSAVTGSADGATLKLAGTFTGISDFPCGNLTFNVGSTLVLPAGASQITVAGSVTVAGAATLDVSALFSGGSPQGDEITILTAGKAVSGIPAVAGVPEGWSVVNTGTALKLTKSVELALPLITGTTVCVCDQTVFDIPAELGETLTPGVYTLASWTTAASGYGAPKLKIEGCPYETELICGTYDVNLHVKTAAESAAKPIKIWAVGDERISTAPSWRIQLAQKLSLEGWNVRMTGARTVAAADPTGANARDAWIRHTGLGALSYKTTISYSGLLDGLESHCAAAQEPDFTIVQLGTFSYWGSSYDGDLTFSHWKETCKRILAELPNTTIIATTVMTDTFTGLGFNDANYSFQKTARSTLNTKIRDYISLTEAQGGFPAGRVVLVDLDALIAVNTTTWRTNWLLSVAGNDLVADALRDKLLTLATLAGKLGAPSILKVRNPPALDSKTLSVTFNKPVAAVPATAALAETGSGSAITLSGATLSDDGRTVTYALSDELVAKTGYTLTIGAVEDLSGAINSGETYEFVPRAFGAKNNVPDEYTAGYSKLATLDLADNPYFTQSVGAVPYSYQALLPKTGITKAGYYIELLRADTDEMKTMWIDMDAPGNTFDAISLPVTHAQRKQQAVTKLHVWSDYAGVSLVAANDDSVTGFIEFNPVNYSQPAVSVAGVTDEYWTKSYDWNDTLATANASGHGCFQIFRKFASYDVLPAEALFVFNRWGSSHTDFSGIGFGNFADRVFNSNASFDRTFLYGTGDAKIHSTAAYSVKRIEFWAKYNAPASRSDYADGTWSGAVDSAFATIGNWSGVTDLTGATLCLPANGGSTRYFTYGGTDPVSLNATTVLLDGAYGFNSVGAFYLKTLDFGSAGKLVIDPLKASIRLQTAPSFAAGAKIALDGKYSGYTAGRFLLLTWDNGHLDASTDLSSLFDTFSASGASPALYEEQTETGGRLWLDLDTTAVYPVVRVMPVGDSITQGSQSSYGNWRIPLMKRLCAAGYDPVSTGLWNIESYDEAGATMPEEWVWHSGVSARRLITGAGAGVLDAIETELDQAGDVDVLLLKIGTNDINSDGVTANELYAAWLELMEKILTQSNCKVVCGAVLNIADETKNAEVTGFNALMKNAIEGGVIFPANRVFFADLYGVCPRYDINNQYIDGNFYSATDLHPDWPGEDAMAEEYARVIQLALANGLPQHEAPDTVSGSLNNVPAGYRNGFKLARVYDATREAGLVMGGEVPYEDYSANEGATEDLARVGYYIELKRKNTYITDYADRVRWLWVDMSAFGDRTIDSVGVPLNTVSQQQVGSMHIISNMPGIDTVEPTDNTVGGWVEFWPYNYGNAKSDLAGAPANTYGYDWSDTCSYSGDFACMQVHRSLTGARNPAQVLFVFNRWRATGAHQIGLGNYACQTKGSMDWTFTSRNDLSTLVTLDTYAYEVAKIEIWTRSVAEELDLSGLDTLVWRPQDASATVSEADEAWKNGSDATDTGLYPMIPGAALVFDSKDPIAYTEVSVPCSVQASTVEISGSKNYTFTGNGQIVADSVAFNLTSGTTVTIDGGGIVSDDITIRGGTVKLGFNALTSALGAGTDGVITIENGGQIDLNYSQEGADNNAVRGSLCYDKEIHISGAGPDGEGAIVNNGFSRWFSALGRVYLDADATIGGIGRMDLRNSWGGRKYTGRPLMYGPGKTLTDRLKTTANQGLNFLGADAVLGKIVVAEDSVIGVEGATTWELENGMEMLNGSRFDLWGGTLTGSGTITVKTGATASILGKSGTSTIYLPVVVEEGATLLLSGGSTVTFLGGLENRGSIRQTAGTVYWQDDGSTESLSLTTNTIDFAAGNLYLGQDGADGIPQFEHYDIAGESTGSIYFRTSEDSVVDGAKTKINAPKAKIWIEAKTDAGTSIDEIPMITVNNADNWIASYLYLGGGTYAGNVLFNGGSITVERLGTGSGSNYQAGRIELRNGAKLTVTAANHGVESVAATISDTTSTETRQHKLIVGDGGEFSVPNGYFFNGWSGTYADFEMQPGSTVTLYGVVGRRRYNGVNGVKKHDSVFQMNGGTLNIGEGGFLHGFFGYASSSAGNEVLKTHINESGPLFRLNNGTINVTADTVDSNSQRSPGVDIAFGDKGSNAGSVTINPQGHTFNLRTGLKGWSDVTLEGTGAFQSSRYSMGIPHGHWTVGSGVDAQLYGAAGFAGGLDLDTGAQARVYAASTNLVECYSGSQTIDGLLTTNCFTHFATDLYYIHQTKHSTGPSYHCYAYRGEFLVPQGKSGVWYFCGQWDDRIVLWIDGTRVVDPASDCSIATGNIALSSGWHQFIVAACDGYGGQGPTGWSTTMGLGYRIGSDGGTTASNYTKFDTDTLVMRPWTSVNWWHKKYSGNWLVSTFNSDSISDFSSIIDFPIEDYDNMITTNSVKMSNAAASAEFKTAYQQLSRNRMTGNFFIPESQAGVWQVKCGHDDFSAVLFDGKLVAGVPTYTYSSYAIWVATPGWHEFELYFGDTSGGYGNNGQSGIASAAMVAVSVNGADYVAFDEDNFQIGVTPFFGLAGVSTLNSESKLTNDGPAAYPVTGTVFGSGTLSGKFVFNGGKLGVTGAGTDYESVKFENAAADTLAGLSGVVCEFSGTPNRSSYVLGNAMGMTDAAARALPVSLSVAGADNEFVSKRAAVIHCEVANGKLYLVDPLAGGTLMILW